MPSPDEDTRYSRLYWRIASDHPEVWCEPVLLGSYLRCLVLTEQCYPHPAPLPAPCQPKHFRALVKAGLVLEVAGGYSVKGYTKERARRSAQASKAARTRHGNSSG